MASENVRGCLAGLQDVRPGDRTVTARGWGALRPVLVAIGSLRGIGLRRRATSAASEREKGGVEIGEARIGRRSFCYSRRHRKPWEHS